MADAGVIVAMTAAQATAFAFLAFVLSGAGPAREQRSGRPWCAKAGAAAQAQARCGSDDIPSETEVGRSSLRRRILSPHSGALRSERSCPQRRRALARQEKKRR